MLLRSQLHPGDGGPPPDPVPAPDLEAPAQVLADDGLVDVDELGVESSVDGLDGVQGTGASSACACDEEPAEDSARDSVYGSAVWEHRVGAELIDLVEGLRVKLRPKLAGAGDVEDALDHVLGEVRLAGWGTHERWWLRCDDCRMAWLYTIGKRKAANWWKERSNEQARARLLAAETPFEAPVSAPMPGPAPGGTLLERLSQVHGLGALTEVEAKIRRTPTLRRVLERATVDLRSGREPDLRPAVAMLVPLPRWAHHRLRTTVPVPLSVREAVRVGVAPDTSRAHKELTHLWAANQRPGHVCAGQMIAAGLVDHVRSPDLARRHARAAVRGRVEMFSHLSLREHHGCATQMAGCTPVDEFHGVDLTRAGA